MIKPLILACLASFALAQTAEIYDLSPSDSSEGRRLYKAKAEADAAFDRYVDLMSVKYVPQKNCVVAAVGDSQGGRKIPCRYGEFDAEFKHAVPAKTPPINGSPYVNGGCVKWNANGTLENSVLPCVAW